MDNTYYDRYKSFRNDGMILKIPSLKIEWMSSDLYVVFNKDKMRLDTLSYKYYGSPDYAWLLMLANPQYGSMEFDIPDGVRFRIPYPIDNALYRYETEVKKYFDNYTK